MCMTLLMIRAAPDLNLRLFVAPAKKPVGMAAGMNGHLPTLSYGAHGKRVGEYRWH